MAILSFFKDPKKPKTKSRRKYLIAQLDKLMSIKVRTRDGYRCKKCGKQPCFHHHIFTKQRISTRWDLSNGVALCFHDHRWAHAAGEEFRQWCMGWMGEVGYSALYIKSQMRGGFREVDLEWLLKEMKGRVAQDGADTNSKARVFPT